MSIYRVTSNVLSNQSLYFLGQNMSALSSLQEKMSSQQNINKPSDDPVGLTRLLYLNTSLAADTRYSSNIDSALTETNTADTVLNNMTTLVQRAQELATQAATFSNNQDGRNAIALEIDQIVNQLVQLGNTDISGKYIFGGFKTDTPPFSRTGDDINYNGTPTTEPWQRPIEVSQGIQVPVNINGDNLLGQVQVTTPGPPLPVTFSGTSHGLFQTLINLKQNLESAGDPIQLSEIRNRLDELTTGLNDVLKEQSTVGAITNRLTLTQGRIQDRQSVLTQQFASIQNVDMPKTIANLNQQQNTFQASLSVVGRLLSTSLLDYLR
jgi:flagellar hook-associated protein 3 FlgL